MGELVALDLPAGPGFVDALRAAWDAGDAWDAWDAWDARDALAAGAAGAADKAVIRMSEKLLELLTLAPLP